jgi:hypothetical protein
MKSNYYVFYRFCWGIAVGYFLIHPAFHGNFSHRYDDIKNLFNYKKEAKKNISYKNELHELDNLVLVTFKNRYGDRIGREKFKTYKNLNNYSNQLNPNSEAYLKSRGYSSPNKNSNFNSKNDQSNLDNRSNQLNPNNDAYYQSRGSENSSQSNSSQSANDNHSNQMNPNNAAYSSGKGK